MSALMYQLGVYIAEEMIEIAELQRNMEMGKFELVTLKI